MWVRVVSFAVVLLVGFAPAAMSEPPAGGSAALERKMVGTWAGGGCDGNLLLRADGTYAVDRRWAGRGTTAKGRGKCGGTPSRPPWSLPARSRESRRRLARPLSWRFSGWTTSNSRSATRAGMAARRANTRELRNESAAQSRRFLTSPGMSIPGVLVHFLRTGALSCSHSPSATSGPVLRQGPKIVAARPASSQAGPDALAFPPARAIPRSWLITKRYPVCAANGVKGGICHKSDTQARNY